MKQFLRKFLSCMLFGFVLAFGSAGSANAADPKFALTTTSTNSFTFILYAHGTFTVDCGDGGTLSGPASTVSGTTITRPDSLSASAANSTYTCSWSTTTAHTIGFDGTPTTYAGSVPVMVFSDRTKIASVSGDLSAIFSYKSGYPMFEYLFKDCTNLTSIPGTLFSGITTGGADMFRETFYGCTNLTSIPAGLFSGIKSGGSYMFAYTFYGCTNLTSIPDGLFSGLTSGATMMFFQTFQGCKKLTSIPGNMFSGIKTGQTSMFGSTFKNCTGLTSIPETLFSGITTGASTLFSGTFNGCTKLTSIPGGLFGGIKAPANYMFSSTFSGCTGLTSIPGTLFSGITTGASSMFRETFYGCTKLTSIPETLFRGITTGGSYMFRETFRGCTGLTSLPKNLFAGVTTAAERMFESTFRSCSNLTGYIPSSTFAGLIANGHPNGTSMWWDAFLDTQLATSCPTGTTQYITGYEGTDAKTTWNGRVSCEPETYTVTYACGTGGGTAPTTNTSATYDESFTPATNTCTKSGYSFSGWLVSGTSDIKPAGTAFTWTYTENKTLTAQWTAIDYTVSFAAGSGTGTMSSQTGKHIGDTITLPSSTFTAPTGYHFDKWSCDNSIGDKAAGATFTMPAANVTCTAQWAGNPTNITYACGTGATGTAPNSGTATYGLDFLFPANNTCAKSGYTFNGWDCNGLTETQAANAGLPSGYKQLKYIQSTGTQWIDTGFVFDGTTVRYDFMYNVPTAMSNKSLFGASDGNVNWSGVEYFYGSSGNTNNYSLTYIGSSGSLNQRASTPGTTYPYSLFIDRRGQTYQLQKGGMSYSGSFSGSVTDSVSVGIFAHNMGTSVTQYSSYKNYGLKITQDSTLVHNFVPARRSSDSVVGMYDTVGGTFKTNSGSGTFTAGNPTWTYDGSTMSCTANWAPIDYTVSFAKGSGTGTINAQTGKHIGDTITLPANSFTAPSGYHFDKWSCDNGIGGKDARSTFTMPAANVICTAQWGANVLDLTWYAEGGNTVVATSPDCTYGSTITNLPTPPDKPGYHFTRWKIKQ